MSFLNELWIIKQVNQAVGGEAQIFFFHITRINGTWNYRTRSKKYPVIWIIIFYWYGSCRFKFIDTQCYENEENLSVNQQNQSVIQPIIQPVNQKNKPVRQHDQPVNQPITQQPVNQKNKPVRQQDKPVTQQPVNHPVSQQPVNQKNKSKEKIQKKEQ